ncbi:MAG: hypothetical protein U9Q27_00915 [Patescibacteria group bacterium]|nr:hypothetical protein [Patescibacteria group bacterium]
MKKTYNHLIEKHKQKIPLTILIYFLSTFIIVRSFVYAWTYDYIPQISLIINETHIHHLNYGIFILAAVGYWLLVKDNNGNKFKIAKIYGIGLALALDEFGMWLYLENNYWIRASYDIIIITTTLLLNHIYFHNIWRKIFKEYMILAKKILNNFRKKKNIKLD